LSTNTCIFIQLPIILLLFAPHIGNNTVEKDSNLNINMRDFFSGTQPINTKNNEIIQTIDAFEKNLSPFKWCITTQNSVAISQPNAQYEEKYTENKRTRVQLYSIVTLGILLAHFSYSLSQSVLSTKHVHIPKCCHRYAGMFLLKSSYKSQKLYCADHEGKNGKTSILRTNNDHT